MKLPVYPNKFFEKTSMESEMFFTRWKGLGQPKQETQRVFSATQVSDVFPNRSCGMDVSRIGVEFKI